MSIYRKAFWIWLGVMVPLVAILTIIGLTCESCIIQDEGWFYEAPAARP
jgi:uncharacterized membrane protein YhaH (DUF805 family)